MVKLVHAHVPKTAGSALNRRLIHANVPRKRQMEGYGDAALRRDFYTGRKLARLEEIDVFIGHVPVGFFDHSGLSPVYVTLLREPMERFASFMNFVVADRSHGIWALLTAEEKQRVSDDPDALVALIAGKPRLRDRFSDMETRMLGGVGLWRTEQRGVGFDDLQTALHALDRPGLRIGLTEAFDAFASDLEEEYGWRLQDAPDLSTPVRTTLDPKLPIAARAEKNSVGPSRSRRSRHHRTRESQT